MNRWTYGFGENSGKVYCNGVCYDALALVKTLNTLEYRVAEMELDKVELAKLRIQHEYLQSRLKGDWETARKLEAQYGIR